MKKTMQTPKSELPHAVTQLLRVQNQLFYYLDGGEYPDGGPIQDTTDDEDD